jgi:putative ABC transport system permease protein
MVTSLITSASFALKRLWSHRGLMACLALGLAAAVALAVSVPLYSDGVNYKLLNTALAESSQDGRRAPFNFIFSYIGSWYTPIAVEQYDPLDRYLREQAPGVIGLPLVSSGRYVATDNLQLHPPGGTISRSRRLDLVRLASQTDIFEHIDLVEGRLPAALLQAGGPLEVLVSLKLANDLGLETGNTYLLYQPGEAGAPAFQMDMLVSGIWLPSDPNDSYWFYPPESFEKKPLIPEQTYFGAVAANMDLPVNEAAWQLSFDGSRVYSEHVNGLLRAIQRVQNQTSALLPNSTLDVSPVQALRQYSRQASGLTGLLFVFSAPVLALVLYFLGLVASMLVQRQRNEIAVLRSRGASRGWVAAIYLLEWSLLGIFALLVGPWIGLGLADLVGRTQSFLDFNRSSDLTTRLTMNTFGFGLAAVALALLFSVLPAWQAGRYTIVSYKQEQARARQRPLWQRAYLDLLLLAPSLYGLYTLRQAAGQGSLRLFGRTIISGSPFENPVLFLLPTLFIISLSLLFLRLLPRLISALAWLGTRLPGTVPVLALRQLSRSSGGHMGPLTLMVITLSLAGFVASMAQTMDRSLEDGVYYQIGADLNLVESGEYTGEANNSAPLPPGAPTPQPSANDQPAVWNFLPVSDHLSLPGVEAAARVGRYDAELRTGSRRARGRLVGLDRTDFPTVAFFRHDFAPEPLGALMNRLALDPAALLVDQDTWERSNFNPGDQVQIQVTASGERRILDFKVVGVLDYFPTLYPADGPIYVANLEYIFEAFNGLVPYDVWLRTSAQVDTQLVVNGLNQLGVTVIRAQDARSALDSAFTSPNRQGVLGLLSVGFMTASILTVTGFLLHALLSFRERFIHLGVLRAIGLSVNQMAAYLGLEQFVLILAGLAAGTGIAVLSAYLFIPHLPVTLNQHAGVPPYLVEIAWADLLRLYVIFGAMLLVGMGATIGSLLRMNIFQAVKLGEVV